MYQVFYTRAAYHETEASRCLRPPNVKCDIWAIRKIWIQWNLVIFLSVMLYDFIQTLKWTQQTVVLPCILDCPLFGSRHLFQREEVLCAPLAITHSNGWVPADKSSCRIQNGCVDSLYSITICSCIVIPVSGTYRIAKFLPTHSMNVLKETHSEYLEKLFARHLLVYVSTRMCTMRWNVEQKSSVTVVNHSFQFHSSRCEMNPHADVPVKLKAGAQKWEMTPISSYSLALNLSPLLRPRNNMKLNLVNPINLWWLTLTALHVYAHEPQTRTVFHQEAPRFQQTLKGIKAVKVAAHWPRTKMQMWLLTCGHQCLLTSKEQSVAR